MYDMLPKTRKDALERGETFFQKPESCTRGHNSPRYASSSCCVECAKIHQKNWEKRQEREKITTKPVNDLPESCNPVRLRVTLLEDDDVRYLECAFYMDCGMAAMFGFLGPGDSWKCSEECIHNKMKKKRIR